MGAHGEVEVQIHSFLTSALDGGEWLAARPDHFHLREKTDRDVAEPVWTGNILPHPEINPRFLGFPACSLVNILTEWSPISLI